MNERPLFDVLAHADWSVSPKKRWVARAEWSGGWTVTAVEPVGPTPRFVAALLGVAATRRVLAGFDFPIGLPRSYGAKTGEADFSAFLRSVGNGRWSRFADIARTPGEISIERPFYPAGSTGGVTQAALIRAHGEAAFDDLRRTCEKATAARRAACPIFWTLGGNQVGRGALSGWVEVVKPAQAGGASVWPFDGSLEDLAAGPGLVIAETYPAEAYARPRTADLLNDIEKWAAYRLSGTVQAVAAVVLTAEPEAYEGLENVFAVRRLPPKRGVVSAADPVDPWPFIDAALAEVAEEYRCHPVGCLREKDFESRVLAKLRAARLPRADYSLPDGSCVSIDPVRAQWSGPWAEHLGRGRRHDIVVLHPSGRSLLAELELKTSHSDSHNWFRKREVEGELHAMQSLVQKGLLARARFVMFRYGLPLWEADAETLFKRFPDVEFDYIAV